MIRFVHRAVAAGALVLTLAGCGGGDESEPRPGGETAAFPNCAAGNGSPITLERAQAAFGQAGYEFAYEDCDASTAVADLNNDESSRVDEQGHLICSVLVVPGPGTQRFPNQVRIIDSVGSRQTVVRDNVVCTLYPRGGTAHAQLTQLVTTLREID
jgi:hypothetical protein